MNKIKRDLLSFLLILTTFFSCQFLEATTFHSILIGDTVDKELKKVIRKDLAHMREHMQEVFNALEGVERFEQNVYVGKRVSVEILDDLRSLDIGTSDIVFLYFSGHGFNTKKNQIENWPFLYFNHGDIGINSYEVLELLAQHQPRLIICFVDCCNNILKPKEFPNFLDRQARQEEFAFTYTSSHSNIRKLFQETEGIVLISSASPGFYSEGTDAKGSCFTNVYIRLFKELTESTEPTSWQEILDRAQEKLWKRQRPYYELLLTESDAA